METALILNTEQEINKQIEAVVDRFAHDGFFHYLVTRSKKIRLMLCQKMVPERKLVSSTVMNGELYGRYYDHKKYVLDILARDDEGHFFNLEMQCGNITGEELIRFQCYAFRLIDEEARKGKGYENIKPVRQMIINAGRPIEGLDHYIHHFTYYDEEHKVKLPHAVSDIFIIQLEKLIMEEIEKIENFDEIMYLFKTDRMYDKIEADRIVKEAIAMHDDYMISEERIAMMIKERDEWAQNTREQVLVKKEKKLEERENILEERENILEEKENILEEKENKLEEKENKLEEKENKLEEEKKRIEIETAYSKVYKLILNLYSQEANWLTDCTLEQLNLAFDLALENISYSELKRKVIKDL